MPSLSRRDLFRTATGAAVGGAVSLSSVDRLAARYLLPGTGWGRPGAAEAQTGEPLQFGQRIITPDGTPFGGGINVSVWPDGRYHVKFHTFSSSIFASFDYNLRAYLSAPGFPTLVFLHNGHVEEDDKSDHEEDGFNPLIPVYWSQLASGGTLNVAKEYSWGGIAGALTGAAGFVADLFGAGANVIAGGLGALIGATVEASSALGVDLGPGGTLGVLSGVAVFAVGTSLGLPLGATLIAGTVAGVGVGAVAESMIETRRLTDEELAIGRAVFGDSIPYDNVLVTNVNGMSDRPFTAPGADGKTYLNVGDRYGDLVGATRGSYRERGQLLIHELTHAWQIAQSSFLPGFMCSALVNQSNNSFGDSVYVYGDPGPNWDDFNFEQQASIVDDWFAATTNSVGYRPMDQGNPYYRYIWDDVVKKDVPFTAPGNLRSASGMAVCQNSGKFDVYWAAPDGKVQGTWWELNGRWNDPIWVAGPASAANVPIALTTRINTLEIFWCAPDGSIGHQWWTADGWGQPHTIAGPGSAMLTSSNGFGQAVSVTCQNPDHMDIFAAGQDGSVNTVWWDAVGNTWGTAYAVAGPGSAAGAVAGIARKPGHLAVFWVTPDGAVVCSTWQATAAGWTAPVQVAPAGSAIPASLGVCCKVPDHIDVFWVTPDGSIGTAWWNGEGWRAPFLIAGPQTAAGGLSAIARNPEHVVAFYVTPDGSIGNVWWEPSAPGWRAPFTIADPGDASPGSPIRALARSPKLADVFWIGPDGSIRSNWFNSETWIGEFTVAAAGMAAVPPTFAADVAVENVVTDSDGDGLSDEAEGDLLTDPTTADTDGDGIADKDEPGHGTFATVADSDGDGVTDGQEISNGTDPLDATSS